jgi:hypothetical protein
MKRGSRSQRWFAILWLFLLISAFVAFTWTVTDPEFVEELLLSIERLRG